MSTGYTVAASWIEKKCVAISLLIEFGECGTFDTGVVAGSGPSTLGAQDTEVSTSKYLNMIPKYALAGEPGDIRII